MGEEKWRRGGEKGGERVRTRGRSDSGRGVEERSGRGGTERVERREEEEGEEGREEARKGDGEGGRGREETPRAGRRPWRIVVMESGQKRGKEGGGKGRVKW